MDPKQLDHSTASRLWAELSKMKGRIFQPPKSRRQMSASKYHHRMIRVCFGSSAALATIGGQLPDWRFAGFSGV
jgi:hypothetical protein